MAINKQVSDWWYPVLECVKKRRNRVENQEISLEYVKLKILHIQWEEMSRQFVI